jgi:hypothetical protein
MPGAMPLRPGDMLDIESRIGIFSTIYTIRSVRRQFSTTTGFVQYIQGYATTADSTVAAGTESQPSE